MNILITGGAGFIGSHLARTLLKQKHSVLVLDNLITGDRANIVDLLKNPHFTFIKHDVTNPLPRSLYARRYTLDAIYHLACPTGVPNLTTLSEEMLLTCSMGTRTILELTALHKARFLLTSSSEVYGDPKVSPQKETYTGNVDPTGVRSPYEEGKRFAESLVVMYARKYNLNTKVVRIFNTYGPNMSQKDLRVIPLMLKQAQTGKQLTVQGRGTQLRTFCYVDDVVRGLQIVMKKGLPAGRQGKSGEVYNIGGNEQISILKLARLIQKLTKSTTPLAFTKRPPHDHESRLPDLTKINKLGWKPTTSLIEGLTKAINK